MYQKRSDLLTQRSAAHCRAVLREVVGRRAWSRGVAQVAAEPGGGATMVIEAQVGALDLRCRIDDDGDRRAVQVVVGWARPGGEPPALHLLGRFGEGLVALLPDRPLPGRRLPAPAGPIRGGPGRAGDEIGGGSAAACPAIVPGRLGPLTMLLQEAGRAVLTPWHPNDGDPDRRLDAVLAELARHLPGPGSLVERWTLGHIPDGGLTALGTAAVVARWAGPGGGDPQWHHLLDASVDFLRANRVERARVPSWAWDHYLATGGRPGSWVACRETPEPDQVALTPLGDDEVRLLAVTGRGARVVVTLRDAGYVALSDTDLGDGTGLLVALAGSEELCDCYQAAAWTIPSFWWIHPELEPFLPVPRPLL